MGAGPSGPALLFYPPSISYRSFRPSENAIRSFLIKQEFADVAIGPAITAFMETYHDLENIRESESHGDGASDEPESPASMQETPVQTQPPTMPASATSASAVAFASGIPDLNKINMDIRGDQVLISGLLDLKGLRLLERKIQGLRTLLEANDLEEDVDFEPEE